MQRRLRGEAAVRAENDRPYSTGEAAAGNAVEQGGLSLARRSRALGKVAARAAEAASAGEGRV